MLHEFYTHIYDHNQPSLHHILFVLPLIIGDGTHLQAEGSNEDNHTGPPDNNEEGECVYFSYYLISYLVNTQYNTLYLSPPFSVPSMQSLQSGSSNNNSYLRSLFQCALCIRHSPTSVTICPPSLDQVIVLLHPPISPQTGPSHRITPTPPTSESTSPRPDTPPYPHTPPSPMIYHL